MRTVVIDCAGAASAAEVWQRYVDAAEPAHANMFGRNLDAFWDAVAGGGPGWPGEVKLVFAHTSDLIPLQLVDGTSFLNALGASPMR